MAPWAGVENRYLNICFHLGICGSKFLMSPILSPNSLSITYINSRFTQACFTEFRFDIKPLFANLRLSHQKEMQSATRLLHNIREYVLQKGIAFDSLFYFWNFDCKIDSRIFYKFIDGDEQVLFFINRIAFELIKVDYLLYYLNSLWNENLILRFIS